MNGRRDIDRVLDAWFVDGPSAMPDRLFDAVFDQVERVPQRRLARLTLRLTEMNPRIRLYTAAAAALVVALAGIYLFNQSPSSSVGAPPSPEVTPIPTAEAQVPMALRETWMGPAQPIPGLPAGAGVTLVFAGESDFWMTQSATSNVHRLRSRITAIDDGRVTLAAQDADTDCQAGEVGTYAWSLSQSGRILTIAAETDACATRLASVPGTYWLMDCPTADDNCLGPLDPGTYSSQFIDPFVAYGDSWNPRFGALEYTVPAGWQNIEDWPAFFRLGPEGAGDGTFVFVTTDIVAVSETEQCSDVPHPTIGTSAEDLANWLATSPGLVTTAPVPVTIGGLPGFRVDIRLDPTWTETCPWSEGKPVRELFVDRDPAEGFGMGFGGDVRMAVYLLDVGGDRAILVDIEAPTGAEFDAFIDDATAVVDSFVFTP